MKDELDSMHVDDLPYLERDLSLAQKVSLAFLLFGDSHGNATYILQRLLALMRAPQTEQLHSDLLRQYAQNVNPTQWRGHLIETLCIIDARQALRRLGFSWQELRLHYLPHVRELSLHVHPLLKAMYFICEQLTVAQSGRLVINVNEQLQTRTRTEQNEPLRFYDFAYLEIFLLDWLTRRHLLLGDINALGSDVQLLIEYFKFNELQSLATLLIETVNSCAVTQVKSGGDACVSDTAGDGPAAASVSRDAACAATVARRANALQVRRENAGIMLIINQQRFHRDVDEEFRYLLPSKKLSDRNGTNVDKQRLHDVFSALGYTVEAHDNVDHLGLLDHIRGVCARSMLRDSLIVCILSHGFEGAVYAANSIPLSIVDIQNVLCADPNLHDKPKFLIIQACQENEKKSATCDVNARTDSPSQHVNMVVAMSTVPRFVALRHSVQGSWFIQTLCDTIERYADSEHVLDILTIANGQVSEKRGDKDQKMVPVLASTLKQNVYFPHK